jgi:hypothetical protein
MSRNVWTVVTDIKVIPSESLEGDHRLLVADFKNIKEKKLVIYQENKIKVWKLKEQQTKIIWGKSMSLWNCST